MYLDYEGVVSGDRGTVNRLLAGTYERMSDQTDVLVFALSGNSFADSVLIRTLSDARLFVSFAQSGTSP